jgi:hypothetical protein
MTMNSTEQPDDATTRAAKTTDELCRLFSTTVSSLAADAAALRQVKSLGFCILNENEHPNAIKKGLVEVDAVVTELEGKVRMLQEIVVEEQQSLKEMESVQKDAQDQHEVLHEMLQACHVVIQQQEEKEQKGEGLVAVATSRNSTASGATTPRQHQDFASDIPATICYNDSLLESGEKRVSGRRDSVDPREKHYSSSNTTNHSHSSSIHLKRVSQAEWNSVSKTVRGRITLAVVNDALRDIERVFLKKYAVLSHHNKGTPVELQQKLLNSHRELHVKEHGDDKWVSEQDLRQCCAFFRNGESTARAILLIIRTLRRLKQVPAKHSQVTYVCES